MNRKKIKLKTKVISYSFIMIIVTLILLILFNIAINESVSQFNSSFRKYDDLNSIYKNFTNAHTSMKNYLYTQKKESLTKFENHINTSYQSIYHLINDVKSKQSWQFELLRNMLDTYYEQAMITKDILLTSNNNDFNIQYDKLLKLETLISNTSGKYYEIITTEASLQNERLATFKQLSILACAIISALLILWISGFASAITKAITGPLYEIIRNINKVKQGHYDLSNVSNTGVEMETLCLALNDMAESVKHNITATVENARLETQLLEKENDNLRKDELLAQSEVRMLQNQINPHFLFNTLNMIYKKAYLENSYETAEMIEKTATLLRYGLEKQNRLSDIKSEVESIKNYIWIQNLRLGSRIQITLEVSDNITNISIPGMIIQPLIENSIKHGLQTCLVDGEVNVKIYEDEVNLFFSVSDNGEGMDQNKLEELMINDYRFDEDERNHLGLYNVVKRLETIFGECVYIHINTQLHCGFEVIISINK